MNSKLKLKQYADYKGFTVYQIEKKCMLSHGSLKSGKEFTVDKLPQIRDNCPDLNMNWLIYDEGEMIKNAYSQDKKTLLIEEEETFLNPESLKEIKSSLTYLQKKTEDELQKVNSRIDILAGIASIDTELIKEFLKQKVKK